MNEPKKENVFLKLAATFDKPAKPADPKPAEPGAVQRPETFVRTMNDPAAAAEAARIYNPNLPPMAPQPGAPLPAAAAPASVKPPTKAMQSQGTTSTLDMSGRWGAPNAQE